MKKIMITMVCALATAVVVAGEKPAGGPPERGERHTGMMGGGPMMSPMHLFGDKELGLTKEQMKQMRTILSGSTNEMKVLHGKMQEVAKKQADLMSQDLPDEEAVLKGSDEMAQINAEIARIRMKQMLAAQKILTPEQRQKMREKMKEKMEKRREKMGDRMKVRGKGEGRGEGRGEGKGEGPRTVDDPEAKGE